MFKSLKVIILFVFLVLFGYSEIKHIENNYTKEDMYNTSVIVNKYKQNPQMAYYIIQTVNESSKATGLPTKLLLGVIASESSFLTHAGSSKSSEGAKGLMQIHPSSKLMPVEPYDVQQNIFTGTSILKSFVNRYGMTRGTEAYNAGNKKRNPAYVKKVQMNSKDFI
jgi:soluble lytic murein transglycosylase-like protein